MKVLIVNICNPDTKCFRGKFSKFITYPALTLPHLKSVVKYANAEIETVTVDEFAREEIDFNKKYDIAMLSFMSISAYRAYKLAKKFKDMGVYTVAGGYHATYVFDEVKEHFDTTIVGSANGAVPLFLNDFKNNNAQKLYTHIPEPEDFDIIPDRSAIPKNRYISMPSVIANPGCPNCCKFCVISDLNRQSKPRNLQTVKKELEQLKAKKIIFLEPNFFGNKEYSIELMQILKELKLEWAAACTIDTAKDEKLLKMASECGSGGFAVGLESFTKKSLLDSNKGFNKPEEYKWAVEIFHKHNLCVNGFIIVGMDYDTKESLLDIPNMVEYLHLDLAKYSLLTPMPNSDLYKKLDSENRILTRDWRLYDQNHVVFQPQNISPKELTDIYLHIWEETYKLPRIYKRLSHNKNKFYHKLRLIGANIGLKNFGVAEELKITKGEC